MSIHKKSSKVDNMNRIENISLVEFVQPNEKLKLRENLWAEYSVLKSPIFLHNSFNAFNQGHNLDSIPQKKKCWIQAKKMSLFLQKNLPKDFFNYFSIIANALFESRYLICSTNGQFFEINFFSS